MADDIEALLRRKALEMAREAGRRERPPERPLTAEEAVAIVRSITTGERRDEIIDGALRLYGEAAAAAFKRLAELHRQGVIRELKDHELYQVLLRLGLKVPVRTEVRIVRHGREYRLGEG